MKIKTRNKNKNKKVLAFAHYYITHNRGGGEVMLHEILKQFVKDGYEVDAVATNNIGQVQEVDGIKVHHGNQYRDIDVTPYDIIVTHFSESFHITPIAKKKKKKVIYIVHNTMAETSNYLNTMKPDLVIFNTNWVKNYHKYEGESIVVHPPVYMDQHATSSTGSAITLVNLTPSKGSNMFYNMAFRLPKYQFLGVEGGYWKDKQVYIRRRNISFQKNTPNMKDDVWSKTKVLLMPSSYESYGMVAAEALASGIPVVASPTPGLVESLDYAGIFPRSSSIHDWKSEISKLMSNSSYYQERSELAIKRSKEIDPKKELKLLSKRLKEIL